VPRLSGTPARRAALVVLLVAGVAACFRGRLPSVELYRLTRTPAPDGTAATSGEDSAGAARLLPPGGLAVSRYITPGIYDQGGIVYRVEGRGYGAYRFRQWAIPLGEQLGMLTEEVLRSAPIARGPVVFDPDNQRGFAYAWRGRVREFEEVNQGRRVLVSVELEARLLRIADDSVLWSGTRRVERAAERDDMAGIVAELSAAASEAIRALAAEARVAVSGMTAGSAPRGREKRR
jgi:hypothetical protein